MHHVHPSVTSIPARAPHLPLPQTNQKNPKKIESLILAIGRKAPPFLPPSPTLPPHAPPRPSPHAVASRPVGSDGVRAVGGGEGAGAAHGVGGGLGDGAPRRAPLGGGPPRPPARLGLAPALGSRPRRRHRRRRQRRCCCAGAGATALRHARLLEGPAPRPSPRPAWLRRRRRAAEGGGRGRRARVRNCVCWEAIRRNALDGWFLVRGCGSLVVIWRATFDGITEWWCLAGRRRGRTRSWRWERMTW